jgi:hypothetical protein
MLHNFWKTKPTQKLEAPAPSTPADLVAEAHAEYVEANRKWLEAWTAVNGYRNKHRTQLEPTRVGDAVYRQLVIDPELTAIASRENHARVERDAKLKIWLDLKLKLSTDEAVHVAGERVQSWP